MNHHAIIARIGALAVLAVWAIETGMNATFGYRLAGGSLFYGGLFVGVAVFGALLGILYQAIHGRDWWAYTRRALLGVPFVLCFATSQISGWSVLSTSLADGGVQRDVKATAGATVREELDRLRQMQKTVGVAVDPAQIEAQIKGELARWVKGAGKTVGEASKGCTEPSWAPSICRKVADLEKELARARTAADLPGKIAAAAKRAEAAPQLAEGEPYVKILQRITGGESADVKFWFIVFIVAVMGLIANFGPAILLGGGEEPPPAPAFGGYLPPPHPPRPGHSYQGPQAYPGAGSASHPGAAGHYPAAWLAGAYPGPSHMHGAPINISVSAPPPALSPAAGALQPAHVQPVSPQAAAASPAAETGAGSHAPALPAPPPADRPVDRGRVQQIADQLLTFKAACLEHVEGSRVTMDELYARYHSWAGGRAIARAAFGSFFPETAGVSQVMVGDVHHLEGVRIRGATIAAVAS